MSVALLFQRDGEPQGLDEHSSVSADDKRTLLDQLVPGIKNRKQCSGAHAENRTVSSPLCLLCLRQALEKQPPYHEGVRGIDRSMRTWNYRAIRRHAFRLYTELGRLRSNKITHCHPM
ncbi:hypothetical protein TGP89_202735 [Toxoplasma gondii p89]|uniref:Uncharacterized protein n=1 Tax=Toxoplasma gondii p89 TaxID=943119 RepID=A0A086KND3_TOXGO|nr:hypothetical protein TGP89_202735 [Toxoplasma gondii p89]